jgi:hypothetical protein
MSAVREAIVLPMAFLTVALLGGLRIGPTLVLVPAPLISLVLAVMLLSALVRAGAVTPAMIVSAERTAVENISGLIVLITLFAAAAQVFTLVTPEHGLLHVVFSICFFVQLTTTMAGVKGRRNMLRSIGVLLGAAFIVRFIILEGLYARDGGLAKRLLTTLVEGASLGAIQYEPVGAGTGYVAFLTLTLFMIGLLLLPARGPRPSLTRRTLPAVTDLAPLAVLALLLGTAGCDSGTAAASAGKLDLTSTRTRAREEALARARVWSRPTLPISQFDFAANPPDGFQVSDEVSCRFVVKKLSGLTQKFHFQLPDGRIFKVKYGAQNAELQAEVAGTRLLRALGFSADDMFVVRAVHCDGCPRFPFHSLKCNERLALPALCFGGPLGADGVRTFASVVIERRLEGTVIESFEDQGWSWYEVDRIDSSRGGATRAEIDAFRLVAMLVAHWDNKAANQRLLCPSGRELPDGQCAAPIAMIQDLGATFGPTRVDLPSWRAAPIWRDRAACTISMHALPYAGATFPDVSVSEAGRLLAVSLLEQLSRDQLRQLFTASRMTSYDGIDAEARNADAWAQVFEGKVKEIREGGPCPLR